MIRTLSMLLMAGAALAPAQDFQLEKVEQKTVLLFTPHPDDDTFCCAGTLAMLTRSGEMRPLEEMETEIIRFAISHYRGQMSEVARRLKIGRSTLYRKLDEAAADDPGANGADQAN